MKAPRTPYVSRIVCSLLINMFLEKFVHFWSITPHYDLYGNESLMFFLKSSWKHSKNNSPLLSDRNQRPQTRASPPVIKGDGLNYTPYYTTQPPPPLAPPTILPPFHLQRRMQAVLIRNGNPTILAPSPSSPVLAWWCWAPISTLVDCSNTSIKIFHRHRRDDIHFLP